MGSVSVKWRTSYLVPLAALIVSACSDAGVGPTTTNPMRSTPVVQLSHVGIASIPKDDDLCGGFSPCDSYFGSDVPGMCFLPPMVDNHLSDPACAGDPIPGIDGLFKLAWCKVTYGDPPNPDNPPTIDYDGKSPGCQPEEQWQDLNYSDGFYSTSVRWRRGEADEGDIFRLYVVHGDHHFAHRDVIIDPNDTRPADDFLHAIGYGNEPVKVRITQGLSCVNYDTQKGGTLNAATCLVAGETTFGFVNGESTTTIHFREGNPAFWADFEVSECLSLGFSINSEGDTIGNALVDTPLADCKVFLGSEDLDTLDVPGEIQIYLADSRWNSGPFTDARLNVLQYDERGLTALPPSATSTPPAWLGKLAMSDNGLLRSIGRGLGKLASFFGPQPVYASIGAGWDLRRLSDFQVAVMPVMRPDPVACPTVSATCDLGLSDGTSPVPVTVKVEAPKSDASHAYPEGHFPVPYTRLHFFPENGSSVACPTGSEGPLDAYGRGCYPLGAGGMSTDSSTVPPSMWDHVVVVTDAAGQGTVDWTLADGNNTLKVVACGVARPGDSYPTAATGGVYGNLGDNCSTRSTSATGYDSGPAGVFTPFEPIDTDDEVALYGLPLTFTAQTCPTITVDGLKEDAWEACADKTVFTAPQKGPKVENNAALYTYSDGTAVYIGIEVQTSDLGNRIFLNMVEDGGVEASGDEILVIDFGDATTAIDWHLTQQCVGNNAASLCGAPDGPASDGAGKAADADAQQGGAGTGTVFYEFVRPLGSDNSTGSGKEDLGAQSGDEIGLKVTVTQGQGGGKGGFVYPDPQTSTDEYHFFTIE